jgi:hypothetical protein
VLADLLADPGRLGDGVSGDVLDDARALLEDAALAGAQLAGWTPDDPLRLSKGPVTWLLRCPRRAVAADGGAGDPHKLVVGLLVDAGAKLATLGPADPVNVERALAYLVATGDGDRLGDLAVGPDTDDELIDGVLPVLEQALIDDAASRLDPLVATWPAIDPGWWPRVEEPVRVRLADGAVTFGGKLDILLGGPPTDRPGLVVEIKSGMWHDAVRSDAHLYGLLVGLRDGVAPAAVLSIAAGDGATQLEPIRHAVLEHTAERVAVALGLAAQLAAGEAPEARPGMHCGHCPVLGDCAEGRRTVAARQASVAIDPADHDQDDDGDDEDAITAAPIAVGPDGGGS